MTYTFHSSVRGASHILTGKPCQDASAVVCDPAGCTIAVVSDGHGDPRCYRSDIGSWLACEIAQWCLQDFVAHNTKILSPRDLDERMRQLFSSIVVEWRRGIAYDLGITIQELTDEQVRAYGCTLIGYLQTPGYWLGVQIGDGKLVVRKRVPTAAGPVEEMEEWSQPVPWDEACLANITTSLCNSNTVEHFRYHFEEGHPPSAVFLGSDGIDDTFGDGCGLYRFYAHVLDSVVTDGLNTVKRQLPRVLKHYSEIGSHDDMSVAAVINI